MEDADANAPVPLRIVPGPSLDSLREMAGWFLANREQVDALAELSEAHLWMLAGMLPRTGHGGTRLGLSVSDYALLRCDYGYDHASAAQGAFPFLFRKRRHQSVSQKSRTCG